MKIIGMNKFESISKGCLNWNNSRERQALPFGVEGKSEDI